MLWQRCCSFGGDRLRSALWVATVCLLWGAVHHVVAVAGAATEEPGEEARRLLAELEALEAPPELDPEAVRNAREALSTAESLSGADAPRYRLMWERSARFWTLVARDSRRSVQAERRASELESELSALQTELVRARAAVEQAKARLGRAQAGAEAAPSPPGKGPTELEAK